MNSVMLWERVERGHNQSLPEIGMKHPNSGLADTISHVNQAKHRAATFVSFYIWNIESTKHTWQSHHSRSNLHRMAEVFRSRKTSLSTNWTSHSRRSCRNRQKLLQLLQCFSSSEISKNKIIISVVMRQGKKKQATLYIEAKIRYSVGPESG